MNRNTFYYYFSDIYALMEDMLISETNAAIEQGRVSESPAAGCVAIVERMHENREAFRNILKILE